MNRALQRYVEAASGLTKVTATKAESIVKDLVKSGEAASEHAQELVEELLERQRQNREAIVALVKAEARRTVRAMGLATSTEVERLQKQVASLQREVAQAEAEAQAAGRAAGKAGGGTAAKKSAAKKAAKKAAAKKTTAKKSAAKTTTAKKKAKRRGRRRRGRRRRGRRRRGRRRVSQPDRAGQPAPADPDLDALRSRLEDIDDVPVAERVALFEQVNASVARQLAELDEL